MQVCSYASIQVCTNARIWVCKYSSKQVCKFASMSKYRYAGVEVWMHVSMHLYKYASVKVCKDSRMKLAFTCRNMFPFARCCTSRNFFSNSAHLDKLNSTILAIYTTLAININHDSQRRKCYQKQITRNCVTVTNHSFQNIVTKHYYVFCIQIEIEFGGNGQIFSQVSLWATML